MTESERLGRLAHKAWMDHAAQDRPAKVRRVPWEGCYEWERRDYQVIAMAVADAVSEPLLAEIRRLVSRVTELTREHDAALTVMDEAWSREAELIRKIHHLEDLYKG